jgi:hypothetical protein
MSKKKITTKGNLPKTLQVFAKEYQGKATTRFWEYTTAKELENLSKEGKCELDCVLDPSTNRGFLVGMEASEPSIYTIDNILNLDIYFVELKGDDFKRYDKMLKKHRRQQQEATLKLKS